MTTTATRILTRRAGQPEVEQLVEPDDDAARVAHGAQPEQDPGLVRGVGVRVVRDPDGLADAAEDDLLPGRQPRMPQAVDRHARDLLPAGALVGVRSRDRAGFGAREPDQLGGADRGAGRRVDLARVVALDDLDELEPRRGEHGERGRERRAEREVGHDDDAGLRVGADAALQRRRCARRSSPRCRRAPGCRGRAPRSRCRARRRARSRRRRCRRRRCASIESPRADRGVQLEVVRLGDEPLREGAHPARRADDGDPADHVLQRSLGACPATFRPRSTIRSPRSCSTSTSRAASSGSPAACTAARPDPAAFVPPAGTFLVVFDDDDTPPAAAGSGCSSAATAGEIKHLWLRDASAAAAGGAPCSPSSRRARSASARAIVVLDTNATPRGGAGAVPLERLRRDRAVQRQPERDALVRQVAIGAASTAGRPAARCAARPAGARGRCA